MIGDADFEGVDGYGVYVGAVPLVELERCFFLDDVDLALIGKRRGDHNRLGFAAQLATVRYLGLFLADPTALPTGAVDYLARQIGVTDSSCLKHYLDRRSTRFSHAAEIVDRYHYRDFNMVEVELAGWIDDRAWTTGDGPKALFDGAVGWLRDRRVLLPGRTRLGRLVAQVREESTQRLYDVLAGMVTPAQVAQLDALLEVPDGARVSVLERLRTGPTSQSVAALDRVVEIDALGFESVDTQVVPVRRLVELARWGMAGKAQSLRRHPLNRRVATLLATARHLEGRGIDDAIEVFDVLMTNDLMAKARREAKTETLRRYPLVARDAAICAAVIEILLRPDGPDNLTGLWVTITGIVSRPMLAAAAANILAVTPPPGADTDGAWREAIIERYQSARRFLPKLCSTISFSATTETQQVLDAFQALPRLMTARPTRGVPVGYIDVTLIDPSVVPAGWWHQLVYTKDRPDGTVDRAGYVFCVLEQFHQRLRHREIFATHSTRWTDPRAGLLAGAVWEQARPAIMNALGLPELPDQFLAGHAATLDIAWRHAAETVDPDTVADGRLHTAKIEAIPDPASLTELRSLLEAMMPRVDLADVILDVMAWHPAFVDRFQQITGGGTRLGDLHLSVAAALTAHALKIGLGPVTSPGIPALTRHRVSHVDQNYLRPDTYIAANRPLIEAQADVGLARHLGSRVLGLRAAGERCSGEPILGKPDNTRTTRTRTIAGGHRTPHGQEETVLMLMLFPWEGHLSAHLVAYCREGPSRVPRVRFAGLSMRGDAETGSVRVRQHQRIVCMLIVCKAWRGDLKQGRRQ